MYSQMQKVIAARSFLQQRGSVTAAEVYLHIATPTPDQYRGKDSESMRWRWNDRLAAWKDAVNAYNGYSPESRQYLIKVAAEAAAAAEADERLTHHELDRIESFNLGEKVTAGTLPKRLRFWLFVSYVAEGHTPQDLVDAY